MRGGPPEEAWYDEDAGPLVRLYAMTGGRTVAAPQDFTMSTMVQTVPDRTPPVGLPPEQAKILRLTRAPLSVSEVAAHLSMPLGPVRILLGDLRDAGLIAVPQPREGGGEPTQQVLERVLSGLLAL